MLTSLSRLSLSAILGVCLFGCSHTEMGNTVVETPMAAALAEFVESPFPDGATDNSVQLAPAQEDDGEETYLEQSPDIATEAPDDESSGDKPVSASPADNPMNAIPTVSLRPVLTRDVAEDFALLYESDYLAEDMETFQQIAELESQYNFRSTPQDVYEFIVAAITSLDKREVNHAFDDDLPIPVDMRAGRPTLAHREFGYALPSMRLELLKYLIDRSMEDAGFNVKDWLDRTEKIEQNMVLAAEIAFQTPEFADLLHEMDMAVGRWEYANYRLGNNLRHLRYGYSVSPKGGVSLHYFSGIAGLSKRAGKVAGTMVVLQQLEDARKSYENWKLDLDYLIGSTIQSELSEEEREHLEHLRAANVLLSPRRFFRIRWQSQFETDQQIKELRKQLSNEGKNAKADVYVARAKLYAQKGSQPFMVYLDLLDAGERDPELKLEPDLEAALRFAGETLKLEDQIFKPQRMLANYCNALVVTHEEAGE